MAQVGGLFSNTLHSITTTKLEELSKKRATFDAEYKAVQAAASNEPDPLSRLYILVDGIKSCFQLKTESSKLKGPDGKDRQYGRIVYGSSTIPGLETELKCLERFLEQAKFDPSMSENRMIEWEKTMREYLSMQSVKYQYATLYGELVTEWLTSEQKSGDAGDDNVEMSDTFEEIPGARRLESRVEWERSVFEPKIIDGVVLERYLKDLFGEHDGEEAKDMHDALIALRKRVEYFEVQLTMPGQFSAETLKWVINGLQASDLLSDEKRAVLKDFLNNSVILSEVADVLNMRMAALDNWNWGSQVSVEQRRKLNGTYSIHLDEDLLQAIFLHFIGVQWSVFFKGTLKEFRNSRNVWKQLGTKPSKLDKKRREYYLGQQYSKNTLHKLRAKEWQKNYFLFQLPDSEDQQLEVNEGEEEANFAFYSQSAMAAIPQQQKQHQQLQQQQQRGLGSRIKQTARMSTGAMAPSRQRAGKLARTSADVPEEKRRRKIATQEDSSDEDDDSEYDPSAPKRPMDVKQSLLHLLAAEITINTRIHGEITCFRSTFQDWNPLLPHTTILSVLKFFGVSPKWLNFFKRFLEAPLKFVDEHGEPRIRKRGTPGAHALSDLFGETVLFCLDFAVNKHTDGSLLHRVYDDFWFWSAHYTKSTSAWQVVEQFCTVMGVTLDPAKTGSVRIAQDPNINLPLGPLPKGQIRWGLLFLDPCTGRFEIDQKMIDSHIDELRKQMQSKQKSIFSWIQAWNTYATTFFTTNFGKSANCFGRLHVDQILAAHERIHRMLFPEDGSVVAYLKRLLYERFGVADVPDGFLFFPVELGGLGLQSPFVGPLQIRDSVIENPVNLLDEFERAECNHFRLMKERFEKGELDEERYTLDDPDWEPTEGKDTFMSFQEYAKYREELEYHFTNSLYNVFQTLLVKPYEQAVEASSKVLNAIGALAHSTTTLRGITSNWYQMEPYWKWVTQLYGPEMIDKFGGLNVVEPGLLPVGMVSIFQSKRVAWHG